MKIAPSPGVKEPGKAPTGISGLDEITGFSGTAKTTLSGAFAEAACRRGERTLFVSFDSDCNEFIRNLASVGIGLDRYMDNGCLHMVRELVLNDTEVTLADTYTAGKLKRVRLDAEEAELEARVKSLQTELVAKRVEKALLVRSTQSHEGELSRGRTRMKELRGADATQADRKARPP